LVATVPKFIQGEIQMKSMKIKSIAMAGVLSLSMLAGMPVMAAEDVATQTHESIPVTKTINYAEGVTLPANDNVKVHFEQKDNDEGEPAKVKVDISDMTLSTTNGNFVSGIAKEIGKVEGESFSGYGVYHYTVTETSPEARNGWEIGGESYTLNVYVHNNGAGEKVKEFTLTNNEGVKTDTAAFTNTYTTTTDLTIKKNVTDDSKIEDPDQKYVFSVTLVNAEPNNIADDASFSWTGDKGSSGAITGTTGTVTLKNGETATITGLPAGTKVTVAETTTGNFTTKNKVTAYTKNDAEKDGASTDQFILQNDGINAVEFTNTYKTVTVTGVVTNIAPYITMVVVAGAAIAVYVVLKKRLAR
jgi:hypothetical protein